jgi:light-regulated signal transduction histidine kinase (bacteriophytochrome)
MIISLFLLQGYQLNTEIEDIIFNNSLDSVLLFINSLIQNSNTNITIDFSELETLKFNKAYMESLFLNLITKSIKYSKIGSPPKISIYSRIHDREKQLVVADNGLRFDMKIVKDKIFGFHQKFQNHLDSRGIG